MKPSKSFQLLPIGIACIFLLTACQSPSQSATPTSSETATPSSGQQTGRMIFEGEAIPVQNVSLSFPINGIVEEVLADEGAKVSQGDVIARLKGLERQKAAVTAAQAELLSAQQTLADLNKNANITRADVQLKLAQAKKALDKAVENRNYKNYKRADQWYIDQSQADYLLALNDFENAEMVWNNWKDKDETNRNRAFALQNFAAARKKVEQAEANYNYVQGAPLEVDVQISEGELVVAKAAYENALKDWELVKNGPNPDDLKLVEERLANAQAQFDAAQAGLDDFELKAPFSGTIVSSNLKTGQLSSLGNSSVVLADLGNFQVESNDLTELNITKISEGQSVSIVFDGIAGLTIPGTVERIKPLGEDNQGDITYTVIIKMNEQDPRVKWRMTASIEFSQP
jgi:multidrug efflux pump subunit AcrA (membrane-fusion protein)